jgi:para-nitrobenzyl esterase
MADMVSTMWTNFAKTGDPNGPGLPAWSVYGAKNEMLNIAERSRMQPAPYQAEIDFFRKISPVPQ